MNPAPSKSLQKFPCKNFFPLIGVGPLSQHPSLALRSPLMDLATPSPAEADDEWELCNDDGFIYKRKKRRLDSPAAAAPPPPPPPPDPLAEERHRRERKRRALLKIKGRYQEELALWEHLSNTCRAMQEKARELQLEREKVKERASSSSSGSADEELDRQRRDFGSAIDKLLLQVI